MKYFFYVSFVVLNILLCNGAFAQTIESVNINTNGKTVSTRIQPPKNYIRIPFPKRSFQTFLSGLEIKPADSKVMKYDGYEKMFKCYAAILNLNFDMDQDLIHGEHMIQYLRAQYFFKQSKFDFINFQYDDGRIMNFQQYAEGNRFVWKDSKFVIEKTSSVDYSLENLDNYLNEVFDNTTSSSIAMDTRVLRHGLISVGDVLVQPGDKHSKGHAVMVMDMVVNPQTRERLVLFGQGYTPTQDMHIITNPHDEDISPWYRVQEEDHFITTAQWTFRKKHIRRFRINANAESLSQALEVYESEEE